VYVKALGSFPDRIKNLYFSYLFLLRAVNKVCNVCFLAARPVTLSLRLRLFWQSLIT